MPVQRELWDYVEKPTRLLRPDEIFEQANEELLRNLDESRYIERKSASFCGSPLGEYICMWSNTLPEGGVIALGVKNSGEIEGCLKLDSSRSCYTNGGLGRCRKQL